jgi:hypothetical protein
VWYGEHRAAPHLSVMQNQMKKYTVDSSYRQFYVADAGLDPDAPEDWNDQHIQQRFNATKNIVALCPEGDLTARVICVPPGDKIHFDMPKEFEVETQVEIESGRIGIFGWPREILEEYAISPGIYRIRFCGYNLSAVDSENDFYVVEIAAV